jgi:hypothetical protein
VNITPTLLPALGIAHFTTIDVEPLAFVEMAARIGYATVGLRLHPAFPGAPFYEIPVGSALMRSMRARLANTGLSVYDIEFVTIDAAFEIERLKPVLDSAAELGAKRTSVGGDDPDRPRLVATFADLCDFAAGFGMGVDLEVMPWRQVGTIQDAVAVVRDSGRSNCGVLIDALHLLRSRGDPVDLRTLPRQAIRSAARSFAMGRPPDRQRPKASSRRRERGACCPATATCRFTGCWPNCLITRCCLLKCPMRGIRRNGMRVACTKPRSAPCWPSRWQGVPDRKLPEHKTRRPIHLRRLATGERTP